MQTINSGDIYVMHRGRSYRLSELMDKITSQKAIGEQVGEIVSGQLECIAGDLGRIEQRVEVLEQPLTLTVVNMSAMVGRGGK